MEREKRLIEIEHRLKKATEGPWKVYENESGVCIGTKHNHPQLNGPSPVITMATHLVEPSKQIYIRSEDAVFLANSHEDIQFLLQEIKSLEKILNRR